MSEAQSRSVPGDDATPASAGDVHQPTRAVVAGIELILVTALGVLAWWMWGRGVVPIVVTDPLAPESETVVTRSLGNWLGGAIATATVAGLLLVDMVRQLVLAFRVRR